MSNIIGTILQAQLSAAEAAGKQDAQKNKRADDSRRLARLADQQTSEVENTDQASGLVVHREGERQRDGQDARDTYEQHEKDHPEGKIYTADGQDAEPEKTGESDDDAADHIDLSA